MWLPIPTGYYFSSVSGTFFKKFSREYVVLRRYLDNDDDKVTGDGRGIGTRYAVRVRNGNGNRERGSSYCSELNENERRIAMKSVTCELIGDIVNPWEEEDEEEKEDGGGVTSVNSRG
ncbi:hypothetical protein M0802_000072 [Mischocyttarus mexicanus]|nr:hypothetical protein M0802_000072 [Mischocyttarus mexicanus]